MRRYNDLFVYLGGTTSKHNTGAPYLYKGTFQGRAHLKRTTWTDVNENSPQYQNHLQQGADLTVSFDYFKENYRQVENKV